MIPVSLIVIYISFISLGLPDSLLGSAWPVIYPEIGVPISYSGIIFMIIAIGTVISSLMSERLSKYAGAGKITAISVGMTAAALLGFSFSNSFLALCFCAIPYGLGAGSVDAVLNNYVALYYASRHMIWLHCMWGVGASIGPYIMGNAIMMTNSWGMGYRVIGLFQVVLTFVILISIPLWDKENTDPSLQNGKTGVRPVVSLIDVLKTSGAKEAMLTFFCYSTIEQTIGLWTSSYLVLFRGIDEATATTCASMFFIGITAGRVVNGFLTFKLSGRKLIRIGMGIIALGILLLFLPALDIIPLTGFVIIGVGCAPIYPCIIHSTPEYFGREKSQALVGIQMASAYAGTTIMPPVFGALIKVTGIGFLPVFLLAALVIMALSYERLNVKGMSRGMIA